MLDPEYTGTDPAISEPVKGIEAVSQYFPMLEHVDMKTEILTMHRRVAMWLQNSLLLVQSRNQVTLQTPRLLTRHS